MQYLKAENSIKKFTVIPIHKTKFLWESFHGFIFPNFQCFKLLFKMTAHRNLFKMFSS